jgi:hypothetical protein
MLERGTLYYKVETLDTRGQKAMSVVVLGHEEQMLLLFGW